MTALNKIYLFRMTHIENIPHILQYGITHRNSQYSNKNYIPIGDNSIISTRNHYPLNSGKTIGDYIPFYFAIRTPMLYVIQKGFNGVASTKPTNIIYCVTSVQKILDSNLNFIFTDGHANNNLTSEYSKSQVYNIENILDHEAINCKDWKDENDLDKKRRKEAEFLLEADLPLNNILGYICYDKEAKDRLISYGIDVNKIVVRRQYYF
ncbi:protein of unknown function [Chryseobacterium taichungense]|uniref:DarT domain-containing protein n=2 Tax=Chryseobacterium taichungense TaxID=295069 RepID=A0A1H8BG55_9FLAO|nr:protein of unknown function [Chryseobacterium taichungense]